MSSMLPMIWPEGGRVAALGVGLALALAAGAERPARAQAPLGPQTGVLGGALVEVRGVGEALAVPEVAVLHLAIETRAERAREGMRGHRQQVETLQAWLAGRAIPRERVHVSGTSLFPRQAAHEGAGREGAASAPEYLIRTDVEMTLDATEDLGALLDGAIDKGVNRVVGLTWRFRDDAPLKRAARERAVADARAAAETLSRAARCRVGRVFAIEEVTEGDAFLPRPMSWARAGGDAGAFAPGLVPFRSEVRVSFTLLPMN